MKKNYKKSERIQKSKGILKKDMMVDVSHLKLEVFFNS